MSEEMTTVRIPDLDMIKAQLEDVLEVCLQTGARIQVMTCSESLNVRIYGRSSLGPILDLEDLKNIGLVLVGQNSLNLLISPGENFDDGWSYLELFVDAADLQEDLFIQNAN